MKQFAVALELFQHFARRERRLDTLGPTRIEGHVDAIGNAIHAANQFLAAFGKHKIDEQARGVWMRRFRRDAGRMNVGENGFK